MRSSLLAAVALTSVLGASPALATTAVTPHRGDSFTGEIRFKTPRPMTLTIDARHRVHAQLSFDGSCHGGGARRLWMRFVTAKQTLTIDGGAFAGELTGTSTDVGGASGVTASMRWKLDGRFTTRDAAEVTVRASAVVRGADGELISRCSADTATARLTRVR